MLNARTFAKPNSARIVQGMVLTIGDWAITTGQRRLSTLSLFGQEFLHALLRVKDVVHGVEILGPVL